MRSPLSFVLHFKAFYRDALGWWDPGLVLLLDGQLGGHDFCTIPRAARNGISCFDIQNILAKHNAGPVIDHIAALLRPCALVKEVP
jgi:hypothetical protein